MRFAFLFLFSFSFLSAYADMTDKQIIKFVQEQLEKGTSRSQIVTQLMQNGVDIQRIRTLYAKYQKQQSNGSLNAVDITGAEQTRQDRLRMANGDKKATKAEMKDENGKITNRRKDGNKKALATHTYDEKDEEFMEMDDAMGFMMPDSMKYFDEEEDMLDREPKRKVFGRDIFNKKNLTFEPNMNLATPQNYRLGPGDVVNVDIWGASQTSSTETISPDGTIVLENVGPIQLSGLSVAQAKTRLKNTLGKRYKDSSFNLTLGQTRTITVNVMGEVRVPGTYIISICIRIPCFVYGRRNKRHRYVEKYSGV